MHQIQKALKLCQVNDNTSQIFIISYDTVVDIENIQPGLPEISLNKGIMKMYKMENIEDPCREIISRGVRMVVDHE